MKTITVVLLAFAWALTLMFWLIENTAHIKTHTDLIIIQGRYDVLVEQQKMACANFMNNYGVATYYDEEFNRCWFWNPVSRTWE